MLLAVDLEDVRDQRVRTDGYSVVCGEVRLEEVLSALNVAFAAACADNAAAVDNAPRGALFVKPETGTGLGTRHRSFMSCRSAIVVKCWRPILNRASLPRPCSARK